MSLSSIVADVKSSVEEGSAWITKAIEEHMPALLAEVERIEASPIYQAMAGTILPPEVEAEIASVIKAFAGVLAKTAAPAVPPVTQVNVPPVTTSGGITAPVISASTSGSGADGALDDPAAEGESS